MQPTQSGKVSSKTTTASIELSDFVASVHGFENLSHQEKTLHFGWYMHVHRSQERFTQTDIRNCFDTVHMPVPNLSQEFKRLLEKRPRSLLQDAAGFRLEHAVRLRLDEKYGQHETTIAISQMMRDLTGKVSDEAERLFLSEAIKSYHIKAFRAAIVMAWNLAYDHLLHWVLADPKRLADFNAKILGRVGAKKGTGLLIAKREDFEELKEQEVLDICNNAGLFASSNTKKLLDIQLTKRNMAAHPSLLSIDGPQADDTISSLVNNIVLVLR